MSSGTDDKRCMSERFNYFIRGRKLVLIEWIRTAISDPTGCEPDYQAPSSGQDSLDGANTGKTGYSDALMLQMTAIPDLNEILSEKDSIPVNDVLAMAVVDYIKAQLVEDPKDHSKREYFMQRFRDKVSRYNSRKVGGARIISGNPYMR